MPTATITRICITLRHVTPKVARVVEVPVDIRLGDLYDVVLRAMGWHGGHMWEFSAGDMRWGSLDADFGLDDMGWLDADKTTLAEALGDSGAKSLLFTYDFGDTWEHTLAVGKPTAAKAGVVYPRLVEATGRCPPEDCGGPWGYMELVEALADPSHEMHEEYKGYHDGPIDPKAVDLAALTTMVEHYARAMAGRKAPRRKAA